MQTEIYQSLLADLAQDIRKSRYQAARAVNEQQLLLYYRIGRTLDEKILAAGWGAKILDQISDDLQRKIPGLKGFSAQNLKKMRIFYQSYPDLQPFLIGSTVLNQLEKNELCSNSPTFSQYVNVDTFLEIFKGLGFSLHFRLLSIKNHAERWFYMTMAYKNQWSFRMLDFHIDSGYFQKQGKISHNFDFSLPEEVRQQTAASFKDEYLLDFVATEPGSERILESEVVANIKKFILGLGKGFAFIGNQHRLMVDDQEFFVDLLFYNRLLQCLVAFELKTGKFQPQDAGQLNFYLNVLDDTVRLPHELPSIGVVLCKEKSNTVVEYAIRSINKPMGVSTYKLTTEVPSSMKDILPDPEELAKLL
ncbi:PDDEXK nuclease domain-containing protein [Chitinophaga sp. YIM B06452]|uniref:PDDEXK nuclease domain-containing protein n=1 Tax=Chitinophaga sp. YIM B06452 TaxID=3082158 RepID=UPI0031FE5FEF